MVLEAGVVLTMVFTAYNAIKGYGYEKREREEMKADIVALQAQTAEHYKHCNGRSEDWGRMEEKMDAMQKNQTRLEIVVDRMDDKLDRLIER